MRKIAIVKNTEYDSLESHSYNIFFKIFGATVFTYITCSHEDEDDLISKTDKRIHSKYILIKIVKISQDGASSHQQRR